MTNPIARARPRLTYANVTATIALFIALGGTSYAAITLPRNSVGASQIRAGAVRSAEIRNTTIKLADISRRARNDLRGQRGPTGPPGPAASTHWAAVNAGGVDVLGNATGGGHTQTGIYTVTFARDVSACVYSATLAAVQAGPVLQEPPAGRITVAGGAGNTVIVKTYAADATPVDAPFHLHVIC